MLEKEIWNDVILEVCIMKNDPLNITTITEERGESAEDGLFRHY